MTDYDGLLIRGFNKKFKNKLFRNTVLTGQVVDTAAVRRTPPPSTGADQPGCVQVCKRQFRNVKITHGAQDECFITSPQLKENQQIRLVGTAENNYIRFLG